jgi:hypothetical protein
MYFGEYLTFRGNMAPLSSGWKSKKTAEAGCKAVEARLENSALYKVSSDLNEAVRETILFIT